MLMTKSVFRRGRIREVVPEVISLSGATVPELHEEREPQTEVFSTTVEVDLEAVREEAARAEALGAEAARLEATLLEAAREEAAQAEAARAEAVPAEAARPEAAPVGAVQPKTATPVVPSQQQAPEAPPVTVEEPEPQRLAAEPAELTCEIMVWRGYRKAAFYARTYVGDEEVAVAESPLFRARGNGLPEPTLEAEEAYNALCERLEREGWKLVDSGETWFGHTFRRELTAAAEPAPE